MIIALIVVVAIIVIAVLYYIGKRNSIIASRNRVDESWSGIDVQLKRRHDLVPNLVETVKGYATHEQETFEKTTQARAAAMSAQSVADTAKPLRAGGRNPGLAADLQLQRAVLQHDDPAVPGVGHRQPGRLHRARVLRDRRQIRARAGLGQLRQIRPAPKSRRPLIFVT
jgi:hypothetical protein